MVYKLLALDKWSRLARIISQSGGLIKSLGKLWRHDTLKEGKFVGSDCFGNKYYENPNYMIGRSRWVEYNRSANWDYNPSQVTPQWFGWLHYKTDLLPCDDWAKFCLYSCCWCHCWLQPHEENLTATKLAYYPYSTTRPKISVWDEVHTRDALLLQCILGILRKQNYRRPHPRK